MKLTQDERAARRQRILAWRTQPNPLSVSEIAVREGITRQRVCQIVPGTGHLFRRGSPADDPALQQAYREGKLSRAEAAALTGLSLNSLTGRFSAMGVRQLYDQVALAAEGKQHCYVCNQTKALKEFYTDRHRPSGYNSCCCECVNRRNRERYQRRHPDARSYKP